MSPDGILNSPTAAVAEFIPASIAFECRVVPLADWNGLLVVASDSPLSQDVRDKLLFVLNRNVRGVVRSREWVDSYLHILYDTPRESEQAEYPSITWYWPHWYHFKEDGTLVVRCSARRTAVGGAELRNLRHRTRTMSSGVGW